MAVLVSTLFLSLDGVAEVDPAWHFPYFDEQMGAGVGEDYEDADVLLLGRGTYDSFAGAWPDREAEGGEDAAFAKDLGDARKIVVTRGRPELGWRNAEHLDGDLLAVAAALRADEGVRKVVVPGSLQVVRQLLGAGYPRPATRPARHHHQHPRRRGPMEHATTPALTAGISRYSFDGRFRLVMQTDGNLVLYKNGIATWATSFHPGFAGVANSRAVMQADGNLVVYTPTNGVTWAATWAGLTNAVAGSELVVQGDGNVVVYTPTGVVKWATQTS